MSEQTLDQPILPTAKDAIELAGELGVVDGGFSVHRSDGTVENDWLLYGRTTITETDGETAGITVQKYDPESGQILRKTIPQSKFQEWQKEAQEFNKATSQVTPQEVGEVALAGAEIEVEKGIYDHLFEIDDIDPDADFEVDLANKDPHFARLFKVNDEGAQDAPKQYNYDRLFDPNDTTMSPFGQLSVADRQKKIEQEARRQSAEGKLMARQALYDATGKFAHVSAILDKHIGEDWHKDYEKGVDAIHINDDLRYELGIFLLSKVNQAAFTMPDRVANNTKKANTTGHIRSTSREYVAVLTLDLLGGAFDPSKSKTDTIEYEHPQDGVGQHRRAVEILLGTHVIEINQRS